MSGQLHAFLLAHPDIYQPEPQSGEPEQCTAITVRGTNFPPDAVVYFNGVPVPDEEWTRRPRILAELPNVGSNNTGVIDVGAPTPGGNGQTLLIGFANLGITVGPPPTTPPRTRRSRRMS